MVGSSYTEISHKLVDVTAKADATFTMTDKLAKTSFAQISDNNYSVDSDCRETLEHNGWLLNGSTLVAPDDPSTITWGLWSNSLSDSTGTFATPPVLTATFVSSHTSSGVSFTFAGDTYPKSVTITWSNGTTVLASKTFSVTGRTLYAKQTVTAYNILVMQFNGTQIPRRRLKIAEIDYGGFVIWGKSNIISAKALTEVNPTSTTVTTDTLDFTVHDNASDFNILNPAGEYVCLQQKQELTLTEILDGVRTPMGKYYLDTWSNTSATVASFTSNDITGTFTMEYKTSALWNGTPASVIFADIFAAAGWTKYSIDSAIAAELMYGYIPVVTVREALHQACFALRAAVIPGRDGVLYISRLPSSATARSIEQIQKLGTATVKQLKLVNSVLVTAHAFTAGTASQLYSQTLAVGTYTIKFSSPATGISISGGTITASGVNYTTVTVSTAGTVTITGSALVDSTTTYVYEAPGLVSTTRAQTSVSTDNKLISPANAAALAVFLYNDYQRRILQSFKLAMSVEQAGDNADVNTVLGARKTGVITKLDIDLTGGFLADCEVRG